MKYDGHLYTFTRSNGGYDIYRDGELFGFSLGNITDAKATARLIARSVTR